MLNLHISTNPIGIFDSGMGGLTVAKTITEHLPNENIIYFGDTAHTPWGDKSVAAIQAYSLKICDFLLEHHCKFIVIACHTASTIAYEQIRAYVGNRAEVINVVDPVVKHIESRHANKKIGLIGTKQTIRSNLYKKRLECLNQNIQLASLATPLLVPLIEEGFSDKVMSKLAVKEYLSHPSLQDIHALILGCTHYPLIKSHIQNFYSTLIDIIDASEITAQSLKEHLIVKNLLNCYHATQRIFYVSDYSEFFAHTAKLFFPGNIELKPYPLWE